MADLVKEIFSFLSQYLGIEGVLIIVTVFTFIYIWFQCLKIKLLEEKKEELERELEQSSKEHMRESRSFQNVQIKKDEKENFLKTILIAEDEELLREMLADFIKEEFKGISVIGARDGEEALKYIEQYHPSILILDLLMPRKTGYEVLEELSRRKEDLPILVISAYVVSKEKLTRKMKMSNLRFEFLSKPFTPEEMFKIIRKLGRKEK